MTLAGAASRASGAARRARSALAPGALILLYHRVALEEGDPSGLTVTPHHFSEHLEVLASRGRVVPTRTLARAAADRSRSPGAIAITFDDGYLDNLANARPALACHDLPATVFVVSGQVGRETAFWWDELEQLLLRPGALADPLMIEVDGARRSWALGDSAVFETSDLRRHRRWYADRHAPPTPRHAVFLELRAAMRDLAAPNRDEVLHQLRAAVIGEPPAVSAARRCVSAAELAELIEGDLIEVGAHTVTHPFLPVLSEDRQRDEVVRSKRELEEILGRPVDGFAYPHGGVGSASLGAVRSAGFDYACSTRVATVRRRSDPHLLPRIGVKDWDGDEFERRLRTAFRR